MSAETDVLDSDVVVTTTVGVTGHLWRSAVSVWGAVTPWGETTEQTLDWAIAADDRWHVPAEEPAVRQQRIDGTPVLETRVRIPDGDAVQRVWSVADRGGLTVIEIENDSPLPFAVAFFGRDVLTERTPTDNPIQGIDLPAGAITLPVAHHTSIRVAIPHVSIPAGLDPHGVSLSGLASADAVARGWTMLTNRASRVDLPDVGLASALTAARCDLLLEGPTDAEIDPVGFVLDVGELVRCGDDAEPWLIEVVAPLESVARGDDPQLAAAVGAAARVALAAGDDRAAKDIAKLYERIVRRNIASELGPFSELVRGPSVGRFVAAVEQRLANGGDLLPIGLPAAWLGANFELHGVPTSPTSTVSLAVRWHGDRPAALWEQTGSPCQLTASAVDADWASDLVSGEALWARPRSVRSTSLALGVDTAPVVTAPMDTAPVVTAPLDTALVDTALVDTALVDTALVDTALVDTALVDTAPQGEVGTEPTPPVIDDSDSTSFS